MILRCTTSLVSSSFTRRSESFDFGFGSELIFAFKVIKERLSCSRRLSD